MLWDPQLRDHRCLAAPQRCCLSTTTVTYCKHSLNLG
jgi:hypothetical protein